jgi:SAM-dependent methyltransferase
MSIDPLLSESNSLVPFALQHLAGMDRQRLLATLTQPRSGEIEKFFGQPPDHATQARFTGLSSEQTFQQALTYLEVCADSAKRNGLPLAPKQGVALDVGCGWGRVTQLLKMFFEVDRLHGVDVMDQALDLCAKSGIGAHWHHTHFWPPSGFKDESVDRIFAYSVFSHLSEDNSDAWVREFQRILRPGGIAFLTTRHPSFFSYLQQLKKDRANLPDFARGAAAAFDDLPKYLDRYEKGEFCFDPMGSGGNGLTAVYGEAVIPPDYVRSRWGKYFSHTEYIDPPGRGYFDQSTIVLIKR